MIRDGGEEARAVARALRPRPFRGSHSPECDLRSPDTCPACWFDWAAAQGDPRMTQGGFPPAIWKAALREASRLATLGWPAGVAEAIARCAGASRAG